MVCMASRLMLQGKSEYVLMELLISFFLMRKSPEPLPRGHPLITGQFPNLIIAPHWGTATDATVKAMTKGIFSD